VDHLTALCFTASNAARAWEFVRDLSAACSRQQATVISTISHLFLVTDSEQCGTSWCDILQSNVYFYVTALRNTDLLASVGENFDVNFLMKKFPVGKQFTIW
jgi:hypothetical protein